MIRADQCGNDQVIRALSGQLTADEEEVWQKHVEGCATCLAAAEAWTAQQLPDLQSDLLIPDEIDAEIASGEDIPDADFVVEFLEPATAPDTIGRLGGYDIVGIVGRGGMGIVLKAYDQELKRFVALKTLAPHLSANALARKRFSREAQAAAAVVHLNVIAIHQVQGQGRLPYFVMPFVSGESLEHRITRTGPLELDQVLRIGRQVASGLAAAHEQGLVHRDVKPANILLETGVERVVLTDFGLARASDDVSLTRINVIAGTPEYMSPEAARGDAIDPRSDLFSLGSVLYRAATGVSPFRADTAIATLRRVADERPRPLAAVHSGLPQWFETLLFRLMEKEPSKRISTAQEVCQLLDECLSHLQSPATVPVPPLLARDPEKPRWRWALVALGSLAVLVVLALSVLNRDSDHRGEESGRPLAALRALGGNVEEQPSGLRVDIRSKQSFTDHSLELLLARPDISDLTLEQVMITDAGLLKLRPLNRVQRLILNASGVTGEGLKNLAQLPLRNTVMSMGLRATAIEDEDLVWLRSFPNLRRIDVAQTVITDEGLKHLHGLPIDILNVSGTNVTQAGIAELRRQNPSRLTLQD